MAVEISTQRRASIYFQRARAYSEAAKAVLEARTSLQDLYEPLLQIQCQAIEIALKAFLLSRGTSLPRIGKMGHSLSKLFRSAINGGLLVDFDDLRITIWMETAYANHALRYGPIGYSVSLQEPRRFHSCCTRVLDQIGSHLDGEIIPVPHPVSAQLIDMHIAVISEMYRVHVERFEMDVGIE